MKYTWEEALCTAKEYHKKIWTARLRDNEEYDEDGKIYNSFPSIVKDALQYLYDSGEFD